MGLRLILFKINIFSRHHHKILVWCEMRVEKKLKSMTVIIVYLIFKKQCYVSGMIMINLY